MEQKAILHVAGAPVIYFFSSNSVEPSTFVAYSGESLLKQFHANVVLNHHPFLRLTGCLARWCVYDTCTQPPKPTAPTAAIQLRR